MMCRIRFVSEERPLIRDVICYKTESDFSSVPKIKPILSSLVLFRKLLTPQVIDFFNGAILALTGNPVQMATAKLKPVLAVEIGKPPDASSHDDATPAVNPIIAQNRLQARLLFRSFAATIVGLRLHQISFKKVSLSVSRAEGWDQKEDTPPEFRGYLESELQAMDFSLEELLGVVEEMKELERKERQKEAEKLAWMRSNRIAISNIDCNVLDEQALRVLVSQFGALRSFHMVKEEGGRGSSDTWEKIATGDGEKVEHVKAMYLCAHVTL